MCREELWWEMCVMTTCRCRAKQTFTHGWKFISSALTCCCLAQGIELMTSVTSKAYFIHFTTLIEDPRITQMLVLNIKTTKFYYCYYNTTRFLKKLELRVLCMTIHLAGCALCAGDCLTCVPILFVCRQHALTIILNKHFKQYKPEQSWSSGTIGAFVALAFCVCSFYTVFLPSYQLAAQTPVSRLNSPLYVDTERGLCCSPPSLLSYSFPPPLLFFFFFTLWQLHVPW